MNNKFFVTFSLSMLALALIVTTSARACERDYIAAESAGHGNSADYESVGTNSTSFQQNGDELALFSSVKGRCNAQVTGQYGIGNSLFSRVQGEGNGTGIIQDANNARASVYSEGLSNGVAIHQFRDGDNADVTVHGQGSNVVIRQN